MKKISPSPASPSAAPSRPTSPPSPPSSKNSSNGSGLITSTSGAKASPKNSSSPTSATTTSPLACIDDEVAGLCSLNEEKLAWETFDGKALYLHRLAVRRAYASTGLGAAIMRHAEELTRQADKEFLRLDCWAGNESLKKYYCNLGYIYRGDWQENTWTVSLFEKRVIDKI